MTLIAPTYSYNMFIVQDLIHSILSLIDLKLLKENTISLPGDSTSSFTKIKLQNYFWPRPFSNIGKKLSKLRRRDSTFYQNNRKDFP